MAVMMPCFNSIPPDLKNIYQVLHYTCILNILGDCTTNSDAGPRGGWVDPTNLPLKIGDFFQQYTYLFYMIYHINTAFAPYQTRTRYCRPTCPGGLCFTGGQTNPIITYVVSSQFGNF